MAENTGADDVPEGHSADFGCAYIRDAPPAGPASPVSSPVYCGAPCRPGSAYCAAHHALCHLRPGSPAEAKQLHAIETLAEVVGGRQGRPARQPGHAWLQRIEGASRPFSHHKCSRYVRETMVEHAKRKVMPQTSGETAPPPERHQHGPIERPERAIGDAAGHPSRPYRAVDTLAIMERRGSISAGMRQAGEDFRARFAVAQLDPLRALDLSHLRLGPRSLRSSDAPGLRIEAARAAVWRAIQAVGGIASPAGSCLWHVLGWERSVKEWALEQGWSGRRVSQEAASGILVAALGALEAHSSGARSLPKKHFPLDKSGSI